MTEYDCQLCGFNTSECVCYNENEKVSLKWCNECDKHLNKCKCDKTKIFKREINKKIKEIENSIINRKKFYIKVLDTGFLPKKSDIYSGGYDIFCPIDIELEQLKTEKIDTKIKMSIPLGYVGFIKSRSSMATNGVFVYEGVIDCNYRGIVYVLLTNMREQTYKIKRGDKICQIVLCRCYVDDPIEIEELDVTERGEKGFGSTGK